MSPATAPLVVSMGDPAGIGLEIIGKAWRSGEQAPFALIADVHAARSFCDAPVVEITSLDAANAAFARGLPVLHEPLAQPAVPGLPDPANAPAILAAISRGVQACLEGAASALVTLPIAKAPLHAAGFGFPGHTEYLAELTRAAPAPGPRGPVMMLAGASLKVALATIHTPLAEVAGRLSINGLIATAQVVDFALRRDFGLAQPRIALAGLNPHAGERGSIGREEIDILNPAAAALRAQGVAITDALSADALFHAEARAGYDCALAMYHDQGLIPLKTLHFWDAANITLGLPIVRASPDHGTGFDIAGKGLARADSLITALRVAQDIAARRRA